MSQEITSDIADKAESFKEAMGADAKTTDSVKAVEGDAPKEKDSVEAISKEEEIRREADRQIKKQSTRVWKAAKSLAKKIETPDEFEDLHDEDPEFANKVIEAKFGSDGIKTYEEYKSSLEREKDDSPDRVKKIERDLRELKEAEDRRAEEAREAKENEVRQSYQQQVNKFYEDFPEYKDEEKRRELEKAASSVSGYEILLATHLRQGGKVTKSHGKEYLGIGGGSFSEASRSRSVNLSDKEHQFLSGLGVSSEKIASKLAK